MSENLITVRAYSAPTVDSAEILRYMGVRDADEGLTALLQDCISDASAFFSYRVCYREFAVCATEEGMDLGFTYVKSHALQKNLTGCDRIVLFAATVGLEIDRLIARYSRLQPAKALCLQSLGAERIEALCDMFCEEMCKRFALEGAFLRPRFSPGYGDLSLSLQKDIFRVLDCSRKIGLTLNESLLMSPTKSVTAIVGIGKERL